MPTDASFGTRRFTVHVVHWYDSYTLLVCYAKTYVGTDGVIARVASNDVRLCRRVRYVAYVLIAIH